MLRLVFISIALLSIAISAQAQFTYGLKAGFHRNNITDPPFFNLLPIDIKPITGAAYGGLVSWQFHPHMAVQSELLYTEKGFGIREYLDLEIFNWQVPIGITLQHRVKYLEVPLLLKGIAGNNWMEAAVYAGPSAAYATSGKIKARPHLFVDFWGFDFPLDLDAARYNRWEVNGIVGGELAIKAGKSRIFLDGRYIHGFTRIYDAPVIDVQSMNRGMEFTTGFRLGF